MSWHTQTLGQIADACGGEIRTGPFGAQLHEEDYSDNGIPVVMPKDIVLGRVSESTIARVDVSHVERLAQHKLREGDIVYGRRGDIGRRGLVSARETGWLCGTGCLRISLGKEIVDPTYLYYYLGEARVVAGIAQQAVGATMPNLNTSILRGIEIRYPALPIQRRIADILSAYDNLIENNTRRITILEDMARRLFEEWFGRDADFGDTAPVRIDTLIDFDPKTKVAKEGRKPFLPMPCVPTNSMVVSQWEEREGNSGSKFLNGDTLLARITPCLENGKTAFVDFLPDGAAGFGSTEFIVMRGRAVPPEFVYCLARSDAFREHAIKSMSGATGRQRVSSAAVAQFEIASPQPERLDKFGKAAGPMFSMVRSLADANTNLRTTRDLLLPKLISGEIEVRAAEKELEAATA